MIFRKTVSDFIANAKTSNLPVGTIARFEGFTTSGDGGSADWELTAVTGTPSQTPAQLISGKFADADGRVWVLISNQIYSKSLGVVADGVNDDSGAFKAANAYRAETGKDLILAAGTYVVDGVSYLVGNDFYWFNRDYSSGVNPLSAARNATRLYTVETENTTPQDVTKNQVAISLTAVARGSNHADCIRANLNNYSDDGQGNTAFYGRATSDTLADWSAAVHGETRHGGGTSIGLSSESSCYSASGNLYGLVVNQTTGGAEELNAITGLPKSDNQNATAMLVSGSTNEVGDMGGWKTGLHFRTNWSKDGAVGIKFGEASLSSLVESSTTTECSVADILLQGNSNSGLILNGDYSTGVAVRVKQGNRVALSSTGTVGISWSGSLIKLGSYASSSVGSDLSWGIETTSTTFRPKNDSAMNLGGTSNKWASVYSVSYNATSAYNVNNKKIIGDRRAAIPDATAGTEVATINAILAAMRAHGLIET